MGGTPRGHHATSVLLHAAAAILLFQVLWRMTGNVWPAAFAAAVFAIHPLRAESVAWVSERKDVLSGLFFMLTLAAYLGYVRHPFSIVRYGVLLVTFALGLMSKPMLVTLPFVLLLLDYWPLGRTVVVEKIPLFLLAGASCMATMWAQKPFVITLETMPPEVRVSNALVACVAYVGQFFYPAGLAAYYPHSGPNLPLWMPVAAFLFLAGMSIAALVGRRRFPALLVGWFWYLGMLVPVIGLVQVGTQSRADRYTYLPQIGLCIAVAWCLAGLKSCSVGQTFLSAQPGQPYRADRNVCPTTARNAGYRRWVFAACAALTLATLTELAWRQTSFWRNSETLWMHALECTSGNARAHNNLGNFLCAQGQIDRAIDHYQEALRINPNYPDAQNDLAAALLKLGQVDQAIDHFQRALELSPGMAQAHLGLAGIFADRRQFDRAADHYRKALESHPDAANTHYNLGVVLNQQGETADAVGQWREALRLQPNDVDALDQLAWALATSPKTSIRNGPEAVALARQAVQLGDARDAVLLATLAAAYAEAGRFSEAIETVERAISLASAAGNTAAVDVFRAQLTLYQAGAPYREPHNRPHK